MRPATPYPLRDNNMPKTRHLTVWQDMWVSGKAQRVQRALTRSEASFEWASADNESSGLSESALIGSPRDAIRSSTSIAHRLQRTSLLNKRSNTPSGSLRPFSVLSTTTPQKNTRLTVVGPLGAGFATESQSSPVANGTTFRGEALKAIRNVDGSPRDEQGLNAVLWQRW